MRIALVTATFLPMQGGGEYVVHHLANQWSRMGHEVCVVNPITSKVWHPKAPYSVARFWIPRGATRFGYHRQPWLGVASWSMSRILNAFKPDVVSGHFATPVAFYLARWRAAVPWIITPHGNDVMTGVVDSEPDHRGCQQELQACLQRAISVVAISSTARQLLQGFLGDYKAIVQISNGVDVETFSKPAQSDIHAELGIPRDSVFLLTVARNSPVKNLLLGLRAFAKWDARPKNLYYVIVGKGAQLLQGDAQDLGIKERIRTVECLLGDDLVAAYQKANVYVSTSHSELCPLVILEAMAAGLPQTATRVAGNQDCVIDGETGLLTKADDPNDLANAIAKVVLNRELRSRLSANSTRHAQQYDWARVAEQYLALFGSSFHRVKAPSGSELFG